MRYNTEVIGITLTPRENEKLKEKGWKTSARGRGNKWHILRNVVVFCNLYPWTTTSLEDAMVMSRGITHRKTYEMIQELERAGAIESFELLDVMKWRSTPKGVLLFIKDPEAIPAMLVREVLTIAGVFKSEIAKNREVPGGPEAL